MFDPDAEDAADPQSSPTGSTPPALRPLRVGARVTSSNPAPTFASDAQLGDRGVVVQAAGDDGAGAATYLVRWDGGAESWSKREHLEPSGRSALAPSTATPGGPRPAGPARSPMSPGMRKFQRFLPLIFILFAGQGLVRAFVRSAHHPSSGTLLIALVLVAIVALAVLRIVRRGGARSGPRRPPGS
ncbi:MAG: FeoB-associated Cys-rich membrane protein [Gaiellales bacterium]